MHGVVDGWPAYGRQSFRIQFADGVLWRASGKRSSRLRRAMQPGKVRITWPNGWPGWQYRGD